MSSALALRTRGVHRNLLVTIFAASAFMTALDVFIVNVGLPALGRDVGQSSLNDLSWVLNAYTIVFAALLVPAGRLADRYGNKAGFIVGLVVFALASLGCALSSNLWLIVGLRCLQAAGGAALLPTSLGLILTTIDAQHRASAIRIWSVLGSAGAAAGPAIGGLLVAVSWRWIFIINVPIGLTAAAVAALYVPNVRHDRETPIPDLIGGGLLVTAIGLLTLALVQGPAWGWGSRSTIACFVVAIVSGGLFVTRSARMKAPLVDLRLFRDRVFAWANGAIFFANLAFGLELLGLILLMQDAWGWSAVKTGLAIAPGPAMVSVAALGLRPHLNKLPEGAIACIGLLVHVGGALLIGLSIGVRADYAVAVLPGWMLIGAGVGLWMPTILSAGTRNLAPRQTSTGSAVLQMSRWIGSTFGVALLVVIVGTSTGVGVPIGNFTHAWEWSAIPAFIGALIALGITPRAATVTPSSPTVTVSN